MFHYVLRVMLTFFLPAATTCMYLLYMYIFLSQHTYIYTFIYTTYTVCNVAAIAVWQLKMSIMSYIKFEVH